MSYDLLSAPIRKYIYDKGWESLRPIQAAAIEKIITTDDNYILASRTASGKTEAAFLPVLSKIDFNEEGVQVLYLSPLVALINDQFYRVEELCQYLDVQVTRWHGEANQTLKKKLVADPRGVVLITPESLEGMFIHAPYKVAGLFSNLKYVIIDEIHSFIGSDRGVHVRSLLSRLQQVNREQCKIVGLSATIGDYAEVKKLTGRETQTKVLLDKTARDMDTEFRYFQSDKSNLHPDLIEDLYENTKDSKVLIFPNSRGKVEQFAVGLHQVSQRKHGHNSYFSHHASVDKGLREHIEHFAKSSDRANFCIVCTSTLELGVDIGSVDKVVQIDATHSISSLVQRVGRSGRRAGERSALLLYATNPWSLLQSVACWTLYNDGFIEPVRNSEKAYDILAHQLLSVVKGTSGISRAALLEEIATNLTFDKIGVEDRNAVVDHLLSIDFLELVGRDLIIGMAGERVVNAMDFCSVFISDPMLKVIHAGKRIGEIPFTYQIRPDVNILLAARMWKIVEIDHQAMRIEVIPASDGKSPLFFGGGGDVHQKVRERMLELLVSADDILALDEAGKEALRIIRKDFSCFAIQDVATERPVLHMDKDVIWHTFSGTRLNRSIKFLLDILDIESKLDEQSSSFKISILPAEFDGVIVQMLRLLSDGDTRLQKALFETESLISFTKWGHLLPDRLKVEVIKERYFDFIGVKEFLANLRLKTNSCVR